MSATSSSGFRLGIDELRFNLLPVSWPYGAPRDEIHMTAQSSFELLRKLDKTHANRRIHLDQDVDIAVLAGFSSSA